MQFEIQAVHGLPAVNVRQTMLRPAEMAPDVHHDHAQHYAVKHTGAADWQAADWQAAAWKQDALHVSPGCSQHCLA